MTMFVSSRYLPFFHVYLFAAGFDSFPHSLSITRRNTANVSFEHVGGHSRGNLFKNAHVFQDALLRFGPKATQFGVNL